MCGGAPAVSGDASESDGGGINVNWCPKRGGKDCKTPLFSDLEAGEAASPQPLWPEEERSHVVRPPCQQASSAAPQGQIRSVFQEMCQKCSRSTSQRRNHAETQTKVKCHRHLEEQLTYDLFRSKWLPTTNNRTSVCLRGAFAARPQQSANTSPCSSLMCWCCDKGQKPDVQQEQTCSLLCSSSYLADLMETTPSFYSRWGLLSSKVGQCTLNTHKHDRTKQNTERYHEAS